MCLPNSDRWYVAREFARVPIHLRSSVCLCVKGTPLAFPADEDWTTSGSPHCESCWAVESVNLDNMGPKLLLRLLTSKLSQLLTSKLSQDSGADNSGADVSDAGVSDADDSDADDSDTNTLSPDTLEPDDEAGGGCTGQTCRPQLDHIIVLSKKLLYFCKTAVLLASYN